MQEGTPIIIKKVKKGGHGHHGGAWKVAYADFVTAMMAFFLVMWILGMSAEDKASVAAYFRDPNGFSKKVQRNTPTLGITEQPSRAGAVSEEGMALEEKEMSQIEGDINKSIEADPELSGLVEDGDFSIRNTAEGLLVELIENETSGELFFKSGSDVVRPKAEKVFAAIAPVLGASKRLIEIEGHTDSEPFGSYAYDNYDLSSDRARSVKRLLLRNGVGQNQIHAVTGKADTELRNPADPYHFSNRRVTILLPYQFAPGAPKKLPANIGNESVEGAFSMPQGLSVPGPDLKQRFEEKHGADGGAHGGSH